MPVHHWREVLERGILFPQGRITLMRRLSEIGLDQLAVSARTRQLLEDLRREWKALDERVRGYDDEFTTLARTDGQARHLASIPGIDVINATALLSAVGDGSAFAKGRDLAAGLGLTPRQHSTGGKTKMLGISKRGNRYLRKQLGQRAE